MLHHTGSKDITPRTAWKAKIWYIVVFLLGATEARASSWFLRSVGLLLPHRPGPWLWWGGLLGWCLHQWYTLPEHKEPEKCCPSASQLTPGEVKRSFSCIPSLLSMANPNGGVVAVISWKPEWSKQANSLWKRPKEPPQNNRENCLFFSFLCFLNHELIMQVK